MRTAKLAVTALLGALLAGCSGGSSAAPATSATSPGTPSPAPGAASPATAGQSPLTKALLAPGDLPAGYAVVTQASTAPATATPQDCYARFDSLGRKDTASTAEAETSFRNEKAGSVVEQSVQRYADASTPSPTLANLSALLTQCASFDRAGAGGATTRYTSARLDFPTLGDSTVAVRIAGTLGSVGIVLDVVGVRKGADVVFVAFGSTKADPALLEKLARISLVRLAAG